MNTNNLTSSENLLNNYSDSAIQIRRATGFVINVLILYIPTTLAAAVPFVFADIIRNGTLTIISLVVLYLLSIVVFLSPSFLYFYLMENTNQQTVGKMAMNLKVVNKDGEKPNNKEILNRTLSRFIPIDPFSYIFLKNGIHDRISKTVVVRKRF